MDTTTNSTVVIVGAGPTGVTAATLLAQYGIDTVVLDRWAGVYPQPRAVHLDDEVYRILDRLGIGEQFSAISRPALGLRLLDPQLRVLAEFHRDPAQSRHGHPQANMFDQPEFETLLRANLQRHPRAVLRGNAEVTGISEIGGRIRVSFTDRTDDSEHIVDAEYLLGCDGANSLTRRTIGSEMEDLNFEQRWLVIDVATTTDLQQWSGVHQLCDSRRAGTFMQIGATRYRWEFRLLDGERAEDFARIDSLGPLIAPWTTDVDDSALEIVRVAEYTFRAKIARTWRRGNIFLLGDAAHLTPPFIGQGMCAGLRDAMNLCWKLAGVLNGRLDPAVLDTYQQERLPHVRKMIGLALMIGRAMTSGRRFGDALRRHIVPRMHLLPGMRAKVLDSATPPLPRTALVRRGIRTRGLAGTLCPNPVVDGQHRLDPVLGAWFAVISTHEPSEHDRVLLENACATAYVAPPGSALAEWLKAGKAGAVLLRPDRTVMAAGRDIGDVCRSLTDCAVRESSGRPS